jgi:HPt (histidine-containing phosphotransfer) domain-containing protein
VFLADLGKRLGLISALMSQGDSAGIAAAAHAIKGSCSHFGAARLMELSRHVEEHARRGQAPAESIQAAIESMIAESERVRFALEAFRSSNTGP